MVQPQRMAYITGQGPHKSTIVLPQLFLAKLLPNLKAGIQHNAVCQIRILSEGTHNVWGSPVPWCLREPYLRHWSETERRRNISHTPIYGKEPYSLS